MWKQAWRSYLASLHPRNYKKIKEGSMFWIYWFIFTANGFDDIGEIGRFIWFYIANLTPYFLMYWSNLEKRLPMPKLMYLLPMKPVQRAEYIRCLMLIKITFPAFVGVILQIIRGFIYELEPYRIFVCTIATLSFGIGMYVCSSLRSKYDRYIRYAVRGEDGTGKDAVLNWMCMICSGIVHFLAIVVEAEISSGESIVGMVFFYLLPILPMMIMDIVIIKTRWLWTVVDTFIYEENFNVLGKVTK